MKYLKTILFLIFLNLISTTILKSQSTNPATGGTATGSGGSVSYTVGQLVYTILTGTQYSVSQGVQQPYEISTVTAVENTEGITLECLVYPNPTGGSIKLTIKPFDYKNMRYRLYGLNGTLLQDSKIESEETEISIDNLSPSTYFLKVLRGSKEIKTFKIIKN